MTAGGILDLWCSSGGGGSGGSCESAARCGAPASAIGERIGSIAAARVQGLPTASSGGFGAAGAVAWVAGGPRRAATSTTPSIALASRPRRSERWSGIANTGGRAPAQLHRDAAGPRVGCPPDNRDEPSHEHHGDGALVERGQGVEQ
jgi:hypothetical protein